MDQTGPGHQQSSAEKDGHPADEKMPRVGHSTALKEVLNGDDLLRDNGEMDEDAIPTQVQRLNGSASCEETDSRITIPEGHVTVIKQADAQTHRVAGDAGREYTVGADEGVPSLVQDDRLTIDTILLETDAKSSSDTSTTGYDSRLVEEVALDASDTFSTAQGERLECKEDLVTDRIEPKTRTEEVVKDSTKDEKRSEDVADLTDGIESKPAQEMKTMTLGTAETESISQTKEVIEEIHKTSESLEYMNGTLTDMKLVDGVTGETVMTSKDEKTMKVQEETDSKSSKPQEQETLVDVCIPHIPAKTVDDRVEIIDKKELDETVEPALEATELEGVGNKTDDSREYETAVTPTIDDIDQLKTELVENEEPVSLEQVVLEESEIAEHLEVILSDKTVEDKKSKEEPLTEQKVSEDKLHVDEVEEKKMDSFSKSEEKIDHPSTDEMKGIKDSEKEIHISEEKKVDDRKDQVKIEQLDQISKDSLAESAIVDDKELKKSDIEEDKSDLVEKGDIIEPLPTEKEDKSDIKDTKSPILEDLSAKTDTDEKSKEVTKEKEEILQEDKKEGMDSVERKLMGAAESKDKLDMVDAEKLVDVKETSDLEESIEPSEKAELRLASEVSEDTKVTSEKLDSALEETHISDDSNKIDSKAPIEKVNGKDDISVKEKDIKEKGIEEETEEKEKDSSKEKHFDMEKPEGEADLDKPIETMAEDHDIEVTEKKLIDAKNGTEKSKEDDFIQGSKKPSDEHKEEGKCIDLVPTAEHIKEPEPEVEKSEEHKDIKETMLDLKKYEEEKETPEKAFELKTDQEAIQQEAQIKKENNVGYDEEREKEVQEEKVDKISLEKDKEKVSVEEKTELDNLEVQTIIKDQVELKEEKQDRAEDKIKTTEMEYLDENKLKLEKHETDTEEQVGKRSVEIEEQKGIEEKEAVKEDDAKRETVDDFGKEEKSEREDVEEKLEESILKKEEYVQEVNDVTGKEEAIKKEKLDEVDVTMQAKQEKEVVQEPEIEIKPDKEDHGKLVEDRIEMPVVADEEAKELGKITDEEIPDATKEMKVVEEEENEKETKAKKADEKEEKEAESIEQVIKADEKAEERESAVEETKEKESAMEGIEEKESAMEEMKEKESAMEEIDEKESVVEKQEEKESAMKEIGKEKEGAVEKVEEKVSEGKPLEEKESMGEELEAKESEVEEKEEMEDKVEKSEEKESEAEEVEEKETPREELEEQDMVEEDIKKEIEVDVKGEIEEETKETIEKDEKEVIEEEQPIEVDEISSIPDQQEELKALKVDEIEKEEEKGSVEADEKKEEEKLEEKVEEKPEEQEEKIEEEEIGKEEEVDTKQGIVDGEIESPETIGTTDEPIKEYIAEVEVPKLEEKIEDASVEEVKEEKPEGTKEVTVKPTKRLKEKKSKRDDLPKSPSKRRTGRTPPRSLYKKDGTHTGDSTKQARTPTSPKKPLTTAKTTPSPKKTPPARNGMTSPARTPSSEGKKIPPIKAPVGQAPNPNLKNIKSKIGSLDNIKHKPGGGERKVATQKLEWQASSKIGSLEKATHKPGGGDKRIQVQKLDFKDKAQSKVGSRDNIKHVPGGGVGKIETYKTDFKQKASSKVGSLDNVKHAPGGGAVKIRSDKLNFKERATSKIGSLSGSEKGSTHGSDTQSPIPPSSPAGDDEAGTSMPPVAENGEENGISPVDGRADEEATPETPEAPGETVGSAQTAQC